MKANPPDLAAMQGDPSAFRAALWLDTDCGPRRLGDVLDAWQSADFASLDDSWRRLAGQNGSASRRRAYFERPRGHAKTLDLAVSSAWALFASRRKLSGIAAAGDLDQATLLRDAVATLVRLNRWLPLEVHTTRVVNKHTESELRFITSDAPTSYGLTPDFVVCDELVNWHRPDLWHSLLSASAKRKHCLLVVITNAGVLDTWQWSTREAVRQDPAWTFHRIDGSVASWIDEDTLAEQRRLLPSAVYRRLWLNEWSTGQGDALEAEDVDAACVLAGPSSERQPGHIYRLGVDLGLKHDFACAVVLSRDIGHYREKSGERRPVGRLQGIMGDLSGSDPFFAECTPRPEPVQYEEVPGDRKFRLVDVRVWRPTKGRGVDLQAVEGWIRRASKRYAAALLMDRWQGELMLQRLRRSGVRCEGVDFTGGTLQQMATDLLSAFREGDVLLYRHEGLLRDLRNLRIVEKSYGYRLESPRTSGGGHGDAATAFCLAQLAFRRLPYKGVRPVKRVRWLGVPIDQLVQT